MKLKFPSRCQSTTELGCQRLGSRATAGKPAGEKAVTLPMRGTTLQVPGAAVTLRSPWAQKENRLPRLCPAPWGTAHTTTDSTGGSHST